MSLLGQLLAEKQEFLGMFSSVEKGCFWAIVLLLGICWDTPFFLLFSFLESFSVFYLQYITIYQAN